MKKVAETLPLISDHSADKQFTGSKSMLFPALFTVAFIACVLISVTPLVRLVGITTYPLPTNHFLTRFGGWLPTDLGLTSNANASQTSTHSILFILLMAVAFVIYGLFAWFIQRQYAQHQSRSLLVWIWIGAVIAGGVFVITPAMLSHDIFVYASYGRIIEAHHANPYFVPLIHFPQDYFIAYDDWRKAVSAYGPIWLAICAIFSPIIGDNLTRAILIYRLFAFAAHLINILLVTNILRTMGRSERTVVLGTLLYAWNPLALEESSLGAHNDVFMVMLILIGILFSVRIEQNTTLQLRDYLPSLIAFTLATLIKFTAAPLVVLSLVMLARKTLYPKSDATHPQRPQWKAGLRMVIPASLISGALALAIYAPYWIGHSVGDILYSFVAPPSSYLSYGSIHRAIIDWLQKYGLPPANSWSYIPMQILSSHDIWSKINLVTLTLLMIVGMIWLWRSPTTRTLILATLVVLGALLIVTPWFFPWYIIWLVGLAAVCLPVKYDRVGRALLIAALVFSASSLMIYPYHQEKAPIGPWIGFTFLTTIGPAIAAILLFLLLPMTKESKASLT